jgi:hypothetical protein
MSPEEFTERVRGIVEKLDGDAEAYHGAIDDLMEETLIELGYGEGVEMLRKPARWYS